MFEKYGKTWHNAINEELIDRDFPILVKWMFLPFGNRKNIA